MTTIIEARGLSKWYGQVIAVNKISFSIGNGVMGLLGPNGAGKSTLLKLVAGQLKPSQGELHLLGEPIWNNYRVFHQVGFCPEQDSFYDRMTGKEFVSALLRMHGEPDSDVPERTNLALEQVGLQAAGNKRIGAYSKGMRQRIKIAQAIAHDPDLLILDEPLAGMDPRGRRDMIEAIRGWGDLGKCVIVSSHILHEIEAMTSNILLLHNGGIVAMGDVHHVRDLIDRHPHHIFIRCSDSRRLAVSLVQFPDVVSVRFPSEGESIVVESRKPDEFYERLPSIMLEHDVNLEEIYSPDDNLQAVFDYLVD